MLKVPGPRSGLQSDGVLRPASRARRRRQVQPPGHREVACGPDVALLEVRTGTAAGTNAGPGGRHLRLERDRRLNGTPSAAPKLRRRQAVGRGGLGLTAWWESLRVDWYALALSTFLLCLTRRRARFRVAERQFRDPKTGETARLTREIEFGGVNCAIL